ncbi:MAG: FAD-dependent oxidoreductase [Armatimonadota bacterium]|nr:FAD-dependent oxidoreductase [Armatimonadota bacterium]
MSDQMYDYIIVGGGLAGASAIEGIRERDEEGAILLIGLEKHQPYHRPPLSKKLWFGQKQVEDIFVQSRDFYMENNVDMAPGVEIVRLNSNNRTVVDTRGFAYKFDKLLLATGGVPRTLDIPGGDLEGICYYRYLDDYLKLRPEASEGKSAVVIGGGFIGGELAAALKINKVNVTMVFREKYILSRIFPESLGMAIQNDYIRRGVKIFADDTPLSFEKSGNKYITRTKNGEMIESDMVIVGVGIAPSTHLAETGGLQIENGIVVDDRLQTSKQGIYAAGDNAFFPYQALGKMVRIEHWDNALNQGKHAGLNMAGANQPFTYMPYFFSDLFDFGFEAVGDINSELEIVTDWQKENETGVIYYMKDGKVRGAMMCNVWDKVDAARELIGKSYQLSAIS